MGNGAGTRKKIESYEDLEVWQHSIELAEACYRLTASLPADERYGLSSQIKRAVVSIAANIAEGYSRDGTASYVHFLKIALGSTRELETHLHLVVRLKLAEAESVGDARMMTTRVSKMLRALIRSLESRL